MTSPRHPDATSQPPSRLGHDAIDIVAASGLAIVLTLLVRARPSSLHLTPYVILLPVLGSGLLRRSRWRRGGLVVFAGIAAAILLNLSSLR